MSALVVYESYWGNTRTIAEVIAGELGVVAVHVDDAPDTLSPGLRLLVIGAPTHAFSLPTAQSRGEAEKQGGATARRGVREWLTQSTMPEPHPDVVVFDTRQGTSVFVGSAAKSAAKMLRKERAVVCEVEHFTVTGREGPLADAEAERAAVWARTLRSRMS